MGGGWTGERFVGRIGRGDRDRYHEVRKDGGEEPREARVKSGEQYPFYVEARAVGVPLLLFPAFAAL